MTRKDFSVGELCLDGRDARRTGTSRTVTQGVTSGNVTSDMRRLMAKTRRTDGCWFWTGTFYRQNGAKTYGQFWLDGRRTGAHRASYLLHKGPIPDGLDVMHSCDVKACVNPAHLSVGTRSQNLRDAKQSDPGLWAGERNGNARLDWDAVRAIRARHASGMTQAALAAEYRVSGSAISQIVNGRKWVERTEQEEAA